MSWFDSIYGREGRGVEPNEPEKKGLARFCQMVGRDLGQLVGANVLCALLVLPAALGVSLGVTLLSLPLTVALGAATGLLAGLGALLLADCCLRSLENDPAPWLPRAKAALAAHGKAAALFGCAAVTVLGLLCFVTQFLFEAAAEQGYYPGIAVLLFLALDFLVFAVVCGLCAAQLPLQSGSLLHGALDLALASPARAAAGGAVLLVGLGAIIVLFPVSVFWAAVFGFWVPALAAVQIYFPALQKVYKVAVRAVPCPEKAESSERPLSEKEQKRKNRANWWYYHWGIVLAAAAVILGIVYVAHGLMTEVDADYTVALVSAEALPDEAVLRLENALARYADDKNGDGAVIVQVNNYTWSASASLTEMNSQMAGATRMNTDLANNESAIWLLQDAEGFEAAYGALSENLGESWRGRLIKWGEQPALSSLELGAYSTSADGSETRDIQRQLSGYDVAVFDESCALWVNLNK